MSHELRTPLNAIIGYGEMLQEEVRDNEHDEYLTDLERIVASGRHLLGLINDVLDLSKIEAGKMEVHVEAFDLDEFRGIEGTISPLVHKNSNTIEVRCGARLGSMRSDATKVRQVLFNVLSNASKFTRDGVITLELEREAVPAGEDWITFRISDTGIGMTPEQLGRVFEAFSQAEETTAHATTAVRVSGSPSPGSSARSSEVRSASRASRVSVRCSRCGSPTSLRSMIGKPRSRPAPESSPPTRSPATPRCSWSTTTPPHTT